MDGVMHPSVEQAIGRDRIRNALKRYENNPADEHDRGIVRAVNADGSYEVLLDGDVQTARCAPYAKAMVGDRVIVVTTKDGENVLLGRLGGEIGGGGGNVAGQIFAYAGTGEPSGALLCDGSEVSRLTYSELFAAIGTTYGEGDGTTTFNLPNLEGRVVVGESDDFALGDIGGEAEHSHKYAMKSNHYYGGVMSSDNDPEDGLALWDYESESWVLGNISSENAGSHRTNSALTSKAQTTSSYVNDTEANTSPTSNMQPYIVLRWFISTGKGVSSGSTGGGSEGGSSSDVDEKIAMLEEALTASLKSKTWVFGLRDRGNTETQGGGSTASAGWFNTTCGYKINGSDDWEDYFYTTESTTYFTLNKPGQYRCKFTAHFALSAAGRLGVGWFQGSTEVASNFVWCGNTAGTSSTVELVIDVTDPVSITPKIFVSGQVPTKYVGGHLTNFTIEYLGEL